MRNTADCDPRRMKSMLRTSTPDVYQVLNILTRVMLIFCFTNVLNIPTNHPVTPVYTVSSKRPLRRHHQRSFQNGEEFNLGVYWIKCVFTYLRTVKDCENTMRDRKTRPTEAM